MVEMEDIRGVRLRKFKLRKIILGVRMHFRHTCNGQSFCQPFTKTFTYFHKRRVYKRFKNFILNTCYQCSSLLYK